LNEVWGKTDFKVLSQLSKSPDCCCTHQYPTGKPEVTVELGSLPKLWVLQFADMALSDSQFFPAYFHVFLPHGFLRCSFRLIFSYTLIPLDIRSKLSDNISMKGNEFIRKIKKIGHKNKINVQIEKRRGKGSHQTLLYGNKFTIIRNPKDELKTGTLQAMLGQLNLTMDDINNG